MTSTDEFLLAEVRPDVAPQRARKPAPTARRASTWAAVGAALVIGGVLTSPGPIYPPLEDGIAWNVLDLDLTAEPEVSWTAELPETAFLLGETGDVIAVSVEGEPPASDEELPALTILGLDAATGEERWQIDDPDRSCQLGTGTVTCVEGSGAPGAIINVYPAAGGSRDAHEYPGAITAVVLDDGGLLVAEGGGTGIAMLVRLDADQHEMWRSRLSVSGQASPGEVSLEARGDYAAASGGILFDLNTGERIDQSFEQVDLARDGTTRQRDSDLATLVTLTDGTDLLVPPGEVWLRVDDAFGGPVSLTVDADGAVVTTWDGGRSTHTVPEGTGWPLLRLDGMLVLQDYDPTNETDDPEFVGLDQVTGAELWRRNADTFASIGSQWSGGALASADTIVLSTEGHVEGVDPRTGEPRWSIPIPGEWAHVLPISGGLLVWSGEVLMRLS